MSINDIKAPDNLMDNVEKKLREHIQAKKKRRSLYAATIALVLALGIPGSVFAYNNYVKNIPYSQEIDLARENNTVTKIDATFKYKDVEFKFKEVVADETGMVVLYEVSDPKYSINGISLKGIEGNPPESWGYSLPNNDATQKEKAIFTEVGDNTFIHMKNNPITINIDKIKKSSKDEDIAVDWSLKLQLPVQESKTMQINKEYKLYIGTIKLKSINMSILKTYLDYEFTPSDKSIVNFSPIFAYRTDGMDTIISNNALDSEHKTNLYYSEESQIKPLYYTMPKEIGITLIGGTIRYDYNDGKRYFIDKTKLPMEFEYKGEKGRVVSMQEKDNTVEYIFELNRIDRVYSFVNPSFEKSSSLSTYYVPVKFKNQESIDEIHDILSSRISNFSKILSDYNFNFNKAPVTLKVEVPIEKSGSFIVDIAERDILFNLEEIIIKP